MVVVCLFFPFWFWFWFYEGTNCTCQMNECMNEWIYAPLSVIWYFIFHFSIPVYNISRATHQSQSPSPSKKFVHREEEDRKKDKRYKTVSTNIRLRVWDVIIVGFIPSYISLVSEYHGRPNHALSPFYGTSYKKKRHSHSLIPDRHRLTLHENLDV